LRGFIGRPERTEQRAPTPPPAQPGQNRLDRAGAQALKFGTTKRFELAPAPTAQTLPSTAPAPGYLSNPTAPRNTYPTSRFTSQQPHAYQRDFDDVTVNSDFDATKSDINFEPQDEDGHYPEGEEMLTEQHHEYETQVDHRFLQGVPQHKLHHVQSQSPLVVKPESQQNHPRPQSGRFQGSPGTSQHSDLQLRSGQPPIALSRHMEAPKKRHRSNERPHESHRQQRPQRNDELEDMDEYKLPGSRAGGDRDREQEEELQDRFEGSSDGAEATPAASPNRQRKLGLADRLQSSQVTMGRTLPLVDYDEETLKGMKYSELKSEDWDNYPNHKPFALPIEIQKSTLGQQMEYYASRDVDDLALFFEHLSTKQWEEAGDWLIDKFADLLKQLKEKRQEKRALTEEFETEIEAREKAVRGKSEHLDKKFNEMRASGEDMLRGKMV